MDGHGAGETGNGAVPLAVIDHGEGETEGQPLCPVQKGLRQFPNGIDQVLPRRRIFPAGDRKTILVREVSLAVGEGDQRNADFLIVQFGDSDRFVFSEGPKRRQEGGEHRDGSDPAIERDPHLREKKLG